MVNRHRKGSKWRLAVEHWLETQGFTTSVRGIGYTGDDIAARWGRLGLSVECKNHREITLSKFVDQAVANAGDLIPVVVIHRPGRSSVGDGYVVLRGSDFQRLVVASAGNDVQHFATSDDA